MRTTEGFDAQILPTNKVDRRFPVTTEPHSLGHGYTGPLFSMLVR